MKNTHILLFCLCSFSTLHSQEISLKYGKVTNDELNMKIYAKDSSANAVVLYDDGNSSYVYNTTSGFRIESNFKKKIKILKQEGIEQASISIPYYFANNTKNEQIEGLEVTAYNLENGKIIKTKLDKKYLFDEVINGNFKQIKFSIPNVKVGTVIEYKYKVYSSLIYSLRDWEIQTDIPVCSGTYEVLIPEYFIFSIGAKGFEYIESKETNENQSFNLGNDANGPNVVNCKSRKLVFTVKDLPALKNEAYVWCVNDFKSGIRFELGGTMFPNDFYRPYSRTWGDIEKTLDEETTFVANLKLDNPYREEIKALVSNLTDEKQKISLVYSFIKQHIRWNGTYSFYGENPKESVKKGTGNNAQINFILMSALKDAGITTYPVLISRRSKGRLPLTYPSLNALNTFIVAAVKSDGAVLYMDGSAVNSGLNVLPTNLLIDRGYIFAPNLSEKWVDLTNITKNAQMSFLMASLDNEGNLKGETKRTYTNQEAYSFKSTFSTAKDSMDYIDKIQNEHQMKVDSLFIEGKESMSNNISERLSFTKKLEIAGDFIYINPMIFSHISKNDFTQTERMLPIEFNYPYIYSSQCVITIPDNYQIEELPKSLQIKLNENKGQCLFKIEQNGDVITLTYQFEMKQTVFPSTEYPAIRDFFGLVANKNAEMIVLKKKQS